MTETQTSAPAPEAGADDTDRARIWAEAVAMTADPSEPDPAPEPELDEPNEPADPEPEPETQPEAKTAPQPADAPAEPAQSKPKEIWDDAPEHLRETIKQAILSERGRQSALNRELAATRRELDELKRKPAAPPAPPAKTLTPEEKARIKEEYPEIAEPIFGTLEQLEAAIGSLTSAQEAERNRLLAEQADRFNAGLPQGFADAWKEAGGPDAFRAWLDDQPRNVREMGMRNAEYIVNADEALSVMNGYLAHLGFGQAVPQPQPPAPTGTPEPSLPDRRQRQLAGAATATTRRAGAVTSGFPKDGDRASLWAAATRAVSEEA